MSAALVVDDDTLNSITVDVWSTYVDAEAVVLPLDVVPAYDETTVSSRVEIAGDSSAVVVLRCDPESAAAVTRRMFRLAAGVPLDPEDVVDALGEVANVIGGNVKSLGSGDSWLTLPVVGPSAETEHHDALLCGADILWPDGRATIFVGVRSTDTSDDVRPNHTNGSES